jgi:ribonucleotide monophosphatase NagD (HAD superfamily)
MAAYFIDLDGTIFKYGTNTPLPGAMEMLRGLKAGGHQLIFTTQRQEADSAKEALSREGITGLFITSVESPRIVINDQGAYAVNHPTDSPWKKP